MIEKAEATAGGRSRTSSYLVGALVCGASTAFGSLIFGRDRLLDVAMLYLLGVVLISIRFGLGPSIFTAAASVAAFNFFFIPPYLTFSVENFGHVISFGVMFFVAVVISGLTQRVRNQAIAAAERERRTAALYALSRELSGTQGFQRVIEIGAQHIAKVFGNPVAVFAEDGPSKLSPHYVSCGVDVPERESSVAAWVWANGKEAGLGTNTLPGGKALHIPLTASGSIVGVLTLFADDATSFEDLEQRRHLEAFATQVAMAMERAKLADETERARLQVETEQLKNTLLSSVSHDLRTPLAVITGAASTILRAPTINEQTRDELTQSILDESERLNHLISNLLDMTRLESGAVRVKKEWLPLEEIIGAALTRLEARLTGRDVRVNLPPELPLLAFDGVLVEQVFINLLENALKYGHDPIEINVSHTPQATTVEVADFGPGIQQGQERLIFEKFQRGARESGLGSVGLGLAICRAIVAAHGGKLWVHNREAGGASFKFTLPSEGEAPELLPETAAG